MHSNAIRIVIAIAILLALAWTAMEARDLGLFSRDGLTSLRTRFGAGAPLAVIGALVLAVVIGPVPTIPMTALYVGVGTALWFDPLWAGLGGLAAVVLVLSLPGLIERHDPFGVTRYFRHSQPVDNDGRHP